MEGEPADRRKPSANDRSPAYRQPPLMAAVPPPAPEPDSAPEPDPAAYAAASAALARLPDLGATYIAKARADLGDGTPLTRLVIHAYELARRPA